MYCNCCQTILGWKYVCQPRLREDCCLSMPRARFFYQWHTEPFLQEEAFEESQKYKEGKCIIEKAKMIKEGDW